MKTMIIGGGIVGTFLAQILSGKNETVVIDKNADRCALLEELLPGVKVFNEDGCEPWVLEYTGITGAELVLAVTGDDEDNLVISYLAKFEYDAPKVIARVNNPKNRWLFNRSWGVDVEVSTPDIIAKIIEEEITLGEAVTLIETAGVGPRAGGDNRAARLYDPQRAPGRGGAAARDPAGDGGQGRRHDDTQRRHGAAAGR